MDVTQADQTQSYFEAEVKSNGNVTILWKARFDVSCELAMGRLPSNYYTSPILDNFPFDTQMCSISFSCGLSPAEILSAHTMTTPSDFIVVCLYFSSQNKRN